MKSLKIVAAIIISVTVIIWAFGCGKDKTATGPSAVHDTIPPAAIANLAIIGAVDSTCLLSWTAPGDDGFNGLAARYDIRYATDSSRIRGWTGAYQEDSPPVPLSPTSLQQYLISGLDEDSTYYFAIKTIDDSGNISDISNIIREAVTPIPEVHITTPSNGSAVADLVEISASATDDKGIVKVQFFVDTVLIATDITPPYQTTWNASAKPHGSTHVIFGRATDTDNNTAGSSTVVCTIDTVLGYPAAPVLQPPSAITDSSVTLTWSRNMENDFNQYIIAVDSSQTAVSAWRQVKTQSVNDTIYTVILEDNWTFRFRVSARDGFNHLTSSNIDSAKTLNRPPRPVSLSAPVRRPEGGIELSWSANTNYDFSSYIVYRSDDSLVNQTDLPIAVITRRDSIKFAYQPLDSLQTIYYAVFVEDLAGSPSNSSSVQAISARPIPSTIYPEAFIEGHSIGLVWSRSQDSYFVDYRIEYDTSAAFLDSHIFGPMTAIDDTVRTITSLMDACYYYYRVITTVSGSYYAFSDVISVVTSDIAPPEVILTVSKPTSDTVQLVWSRPNIVDFKSYKIYRSLDSVVTTNDYLLATIYDIDSLSYSDGILGGETYFYGILTEDTAGLGTFSNTPTKNYALHFSGLKYCVVPSYSDLNVTTGFTVEAWVYPQSAGGYSRVVDKTETTCCLQYSLCLTDAKVWIDIGNQTTNYSRIGGNTQIPLNAWSHIAVTFSSGTICFYINGILDKTVVIYTPFATFPSELNFGRRKMYDEFYFEGNIDEIRIWNYARSESEMAQYYNRTVTGLESGLIGYWRFDEGTGDVIHCITGNDGHLGSAVGVDSKDPTWIESTAPIQY